MNNKKIYLPVNWIDGMKVNKNHFIDTDNNIVQQVKNTYLSFINPYNYGLLLQHDFNFNPVKIITDADNQGFIHVKIINCNAVTRGGSRIEIHDNYFSDKELSEALPDIRFSPGHENDIYYVILTVDSFDRIQCGVPDPDENPPRLPNVLPGYRLSVNTTNDLNSGSNMNSLIIGKLIIKNSKPELDDEYVPACQTIYSHPKLAEYHAQLVKVLGQIEVDLIDILHRIKDKRQSTNIAETVSEVSNSMLIFLGVHMTEFRKIGRYKPPVYIFEQMAAFARVINNSINRQSSADKEELLNYIQDWSNLKQGAFEEVLTKAIEYEYNHDDINNSINNLTPFINAISKICNTLSNLDFIGKKKDRQIFVKEQKEKPGSSFLVD